MKIGAHLSIAGGVEKAVAAAREDGCEALQIFTRNQQQWRPKPLTSDAIERFRTAVREWRIPQERLLVHGSYLINLCAADRALRAKSLTALVDELKRCVKLGLRYLVLHPGAHMGHGETRALARVAKAMSRALESTAVETSDADAPWILLENTAGQGTCLGHRFEHIRDLLGSIEPRSRIGVCIDTQHAFAAGYDLSTEHGYLETLAEMDRVFGLENVRAFHLNDSKHELGARVDRHERIGSGHIGLGCFQRLLNDARFADLPGVLELPAPYPPQLAGLRRLADGTATAKRRPRR